QSPVPARSRPAAARRTGSSYRAPKSRRGQIRGPDRAVSFRPLAACGHTGPAVGSEKGNDAAGGRAWPDFLASIPQKERQQRRRKRLRRALDHLRNLVERMKGPGVDFARVDSRRNVAGRAVKNCVLLRRLWSGGELRQPLQLSLQPQLLFQLARRGCFV